MHSNWRVSIHSAIWTFALFLIKIHIRDPWLWCHSLSSLFVCAQAIQSVKTCVFVMYDEGWSAGTCFACMKIRENSTQIKKQKPEKSKSQLCLVVVVVVCVCDIWCVVWHVHCAIHNIDRVWNYRPTIHCGGGGWITKLTYNRQYSTTQWKISVQNRKWLVCNRLGDDSNLVAYCLTFASNAQ